MAKKAKKTRGRRGLLDEALIERIVEVLKRVYYAKHAIDALGFSERVFYFWLERGEKELLRMEQKGLVNPSQEERIYVDLVLAYRKTRAENIIAHAVNLQRSGLGQQAVYAKNPDGTFIIDQTTQRPVLLQSEIPPDWKASARYLEAVDHERWGRRIRQELTTPDHGPTELKITVVKKREVVKEYE